MVLFVVGQSAQPLGNTVSFQVVARKKASDRHEKDSRRIAEARQADEELKSEGESYDKLRQLVEEMEKRREGDSWGRPIQHLKGGREKEEAPEQRWVKRSCVST